MVIDELNWHEQCGQLVFLSLRGGIFQRERYQAAVGDNWEQSGRQNSCLLPGVQQDYLHLRREKWKKRELKVVSNSPALQ